MTYGLTEDTLPAYQEAIRRITEYPVTQSTLQINMEKQDLCGMRHCG